MGDAIVDIALHYPTSLNKYAHAIAYACRPILRLFIVR